MVFVAVVNLWSAYCQLICILFLSSKRVRFNLNENEKNIILFYVAQSGSYHQLISYLKSSSENTADGTHSQRTLETTKETKKNLSFCILLTPNRNDRQIDRHTHTNTHFNFVNWKVQLFWSRIQFTALVSQQFGYAAKCRWIKSGMRRKTRMRLIKIIEAGDESRVYSILYISVCMCTVQSLIGVVHVFFFFCKIIWLALSQQHHTLVDDSCATSQCTEISMVDELFWWCIELLDFSTHKHAHRFASHQHM